MIFLGILALHMDTMLPFQGACVALSLLQRLMVPHTRVAHKDLSNFLSKETAEEVLKQAREMREESVHHHENLALHNYVREGRLLRLGSR